MGGVVNLQVLICGIFRGYKGVFSGVFPIVMVIVRVVMLDSAYNVANTLCAVQWIILVLSM